MDLSGTLPTTMNAVSRRLSGVPAVLRRISRVATARLKANRTRWRRYKSHPLAKILDSTPDSAWTRNIRTTLEVNARTDSPGHGERRRSPTTRNVIERTQARDNRHSALPQTSPVSVQKRPGQINSTHIARSRWVAFGSAMGHLVPRCPRNRHAFVQGIRLSWVDAIRTKRVHRGDAYRQQRSPADDASDAIRHLPVLGEEFALPGVRSG